MSESQTTGPAFTFENDPVSGVPEEWRAKYGRLQYQSESERVRLCNRIRELLEENQALKKDGKPHVEVATAAHDITEGQVVQACDTSTTEIVNEWREKYKKLEEDHASLWVQMCGLRDGVASVKGARDEVIRERDALKDKLGGLQKELANTGRKYRAAVEAHWEAVEELGRAKGERNKAITERDVLKHERDALMWRELGGGALMICGAERQKMRERLSAVLKLLGGDKGSRASDE